MGGACRPPPERGVQPLDGAPAELASEPVFSVPFYLPLALAGVPVEAVFVATHTIQTLYQYWIHTRALTQLGWFDRVFNSPTNHRVHHAINPEYIDKNYAGILILWDRIFGTFEPERATPAYGTRGSRSRASTRCGRTSPSGRVSRRLSYGSRTKREAWFAPFAPPEWLPRAMGGTREVPPVDPARRLFDTMPGSLVDRYVAIQFGLVLLATGALLRLAPGLDDAWRAALYRLASHRARERSPRSCTRRRSWGRATEVVRLAAAPVLAGAIMGTWAAVIAGFYALASGAVLRSATR